MVEAELTRQGFDFVRLNTETFGKEFWIDLTSGSALPEIRFQTPAREFSGPEISSIWNRRPFPPEVLPHHTGQINREFIAAELKSTLDGALMALDCQWVNRPQANRAAAYKLAQLRKASQLGFTVPETLISANPTKIRAFENHLSCSGRRLVGKLVSQGPPRAPSPSEQYVVFTQILNKSDLVADAALSACPAIYQEYVEKLFELRVTVVGNKVFACKIDSQATERTQVDWRRYDLPNTPHQPYQMAAEVEAQCLALTRHFGLSYSAIDLIVRPDGTTVFLEMNPNGQWGWIEEITGQPIASALAQLLGRGEE